MLKSSLDTPSDYVPSPSSSPSLPLLARKVHNSPPHQCLVPSFIPCYILTRGFRKMKKKSLRYRTSLHSPICLDITCTLWYSQRLNSIACWCPSNNVSGVHLGLSLGLWKYAMHPPKLVFYRSLMAPILPNLIGIFQFSWFLPIQLHSAKSVTPSFIHFSFWDSWDIMFFLCTSHFSGYPPPSSFWDLPPIWPLTLEFFKSQSWALFSSWSILPLKMIYPTLLF